MNPLEVWLEGIAIWTPEIPNWQVACDAFNDQALPTCINKIPSPDILPPAERRRAPETVSLALEVGSHAANMAQRSPKELLSVFASTSGDTPIIDYLCDTLTEEPLLVSPTRFLHSIHNAPAGVWSMATGTHHANTSLSAHAFSFANGWLESCIQCSTENQPVVLIAYDTTAPKMLIPTIGNHMAMAIALVISPQPSKQTIYKLTTLTSGRLHRNSSATSAIAHKLSETGIANSVPFLEALASNRAQKISMPLSKTQSLEIAIAPTLTKHSRCKENNHE